MMGQKIVETTCRQCDGTGHLTLSEPCSFCNGTGYGGWSTAYNVPEECHICHGTGVEKMRDVQKPCQHCGGTGKTETIVVE